MEQQAPVVAGKRRAGYSTARRAICESVPYIRAVTEWDIRPPGAQAVSPCLISVQSLTGTLDRQERKACGNGCGPGKVVACRGDVGSMRSKELEARS